MTKGFDSVDIDGRQSKIFLEVSGFVGDYPASVDVIDTLKHSARAPCTHCVFRARPKGSACRYAYSSDYHSSNSSFTRGMYRLLALRPKMSDEDGFRWMGMKDGTAEDVNKPGKWPLLKLSTEIHKQRSDVPLTNLNMPVVSKHFDAYHNNIIAPDHLFTGLIKGLLACAFKMLSSEENRTAFDRLICDAIKDIGLEGERSFYNHKKKKLNSVSMSTLYCVLSVLPAIVENVSFKHEILCSNLIKNLNELVSLCFWWPSAHVDGLDAVRKINGDRKQEYHAEIFKLTVSYISKVKSLCNSKPDYRSFIDLPNVHRLLELVTHSIPRYSHAQLFSEMLFESSHQPLKFALSRNTNKNSHIYAINLVLTNDWFTRISHVWLQYVNKTNESDKRWYELSLIRLFTGVSSNYIPCLLYTSDAADD